jgi:hypothetical protein
LSASPLLGGDDVVNLAQTDLRWLLDDQVLASFQGLDRHLGAAPGRRADTTTSMSVAAIASVNEVNAVPPRTAVIFSALSRVRLTTATRSI